MSSQRRKSVVRHPEIANIGCGCRHLKLSSLFSSSSSSSSLFSSSMKQRILNSPSSSSPSATTSTPNLESFTANLEDSFPDILGERNMREKKQSSRQGSKKKDRESAVEKGVAMVLESSNPYADFRDSMMVMIVEEEMYEWGDLLELLHRLLSLNPSDHHRVILRAFAEICSNVFLHAMAVEMAAPTYAENR